MKSIVINAHYRATQKWDLYYDDGAAIRRRWRKIMDWTSRRAHRGGYTTNLLDATRSLD